MVAMDPGRGASPPTGEVPGLGSTIGSGARTTLSSISLDRDDVRFGGSVAGATLAFTVFVFVLYPAALSVLLLGAVLGTLSALIAIGIVLIYRANRIINFAQGDLGGVAGVLAGSLIVGPGWPFFAAVGVGFVFAALLGAATEFLFIRRFATAPRLVLTVATIGIAQIFQVAQLGLPQLFDYDTAPQPPEPFDFKFSLDPVTFSGGHIMIIVAVPLVATGLALFFRRSRYGVAIRAAAESAQRAALLGIPTRYLNTMVWVLAGSLSGLAVLLRLPIQGVSIGGVLGPALLLRALAAAVIGRMESLPRTFVAAIVLGIGESAVFNITGRTDVVDAVLFAVIIIVLLVQRTGGANERARDTGVSSWSANKEVRPIPRELARLPEIRITKLVSAVAATAVLVLLPLSWSVSRVNLFAIGLIFAMVILSLVVLTGWSGQISLGHLALVAFGSAVAGVLYQSGKDFFVCLAAAALIGAALGLALGLPALRIEGPFFAVTSLAFALATGTFFLNPEFFGWLIPDAGAIRPVLFDKFDLESEYAFYYVVLVLLVLVIAVLSRLRRSRTGRAMVAIRENTRAGQSYGISATRAKLTAFAISGGIAGFAGGLFFFSQRALSGSLLAPTENFVLFSVAVVGGLGSIPGALLGDAYLTFVNYSSFTTSNLSQLLASGVGVLFILLVLPAGLGGLVYDLRDTALRRIARRRDIVVPSLLADVRVDETTVADEEPERQVSTPSDDPLLLVRGLDVAYGKTQVLFGVDFHVERGEIVALLGTNGAGKSTLLSAITGLVAPKDGSVVYDGADITGADAPTVVRNGIVLMPGGKGVFPTLTVEENLRLAGWIHEDDQPWVEETIEEILDTFPRLRERYEQKAGNLSGGEQQMLTLGQALLLRPDLLMIDELSLGLAPIIVEQLLGIVARIHDNGTTIVLVEQSVNVACTIADRAVFMEKGEVRFDGPTAELLERPEILRAVFLQGAGAKDVAEEAMAEADEAAAAMVPGFATATHRVHVFDDICMPCRREHPVLLELEDLSVSFGGVQAVRSVSFTVQEEQIVGIIGPNGAGKTTVFDLISGFLTPSGGRLRLGGTDITELTPDGRAILGLGRSFQDARLFSAMTVRQAIAVALERHVKVRDPVAALVLSPAVKVSERAVAEESDRLIELMNLQAYADKFVGELSTGSRRIVDLACSLAHQPDVLLLDEPSSGIAQRETEALGPVLLNIRDQLGAALVVIEHDMPLIIGVSDRLVALELGAVIAEGPPADVVQDARVVEGYLGQSDAVINRSGASASGDTADAAVVGPPPTIGSSGRSTNGGNTSGRRRRQLRAGPP